MKKSLFAMLMAASMTIGWALPQQAVAADDDFTKIRLRMTVNGTDIANDTRAARLFAKMVEEQSNGAVVIQVFPNDQLGGGSQAKGVEMLSQGITDMAAYSTSIISLLDDKMMVSTMPWTFTSYDEAEALFLPDASGGQYISKVMAGKGLVYLGSVHNGFKLMTSGKRPIQKPEDLNGLKMRIPGGALFMDFYKAFGADPIAMTWTEVFTALQQGTIDGHDNSASTINSANVFEVQKYMTVTNHTYEAFSFAINQKKFDSMNEKTQKLVREKLVEAVLETNKAIVSEEQGIKDKFVAAGVELYTLSPEEMAQFKAVIQVPVIDKYKETFGAEGCAAFNIQ